MVGKEFPCVLTEKLQDVKLMKRQGRTELKQS